MAKFKVSFELDEDDAAYFRGLYRQAKQSASKLDPQQVLKDARALIARVRQAPHVPAFVTDAITTLAVPSDQDSDVRSCQGPRPSSHN